MAKLKHISFAGVDKNTDFDRLVEIQKKYTIAEFGILTSYHWYENGNRYLDPMLLNESGWRKLNLCLHLCGSAAHDAAIGYWRNIDHLTYGHLDMFPRVQLNISNRKNNPDYVTLNIIKEIIVQTKDINNTSIFDKTVERYPDVSCSILLDGSGGRGIDTGIQVLNNGFKVGYAGGINPDNVGEKLGYLLNNVEGDFWIDMESGVRTDDWFDLNKVEKVLEICDEVLKDFHESK